MTVRASRDLKHAVKSVRGTRLRRMLANGVLSRLKHISSGELTVQDGDRREVFGSVEPDFSVRATLTVHDPEFYASLALRGSIGAAESYIRGEWTADNLTAVVRILARNREALEAVEGGLARLAGPLLRGLHWMRRNTRDGSRRNIEAHYDLGNEFFGLFLDPTWMYSCALFERPEMTLEQAQRAKLDRICRKLRLGPDDHVVEIGTGWGGFAIHAAREFGCRVTTTTISQRQFDLAQQRICEAGLEHRIELLKRDYRELQGTYDKLVSIEMIEAVGHRFYDEYFGVCSRLLKPDGAMLIQAITIAEQNYEEAARSVDFIQRYIFPGSCIPSVGAISQSITRATDLRLFHYEDLTPHYARTLALWRERLFARKDELFEQGFDDRFLRMWDYYFSYCEGGFEERVIGDVHLLFTKPLFRGDPLFGSLGA